MCNFATEMPSFECFSVGSLWFSSVMNPCVEQQCSVLHIFHLQSPLPPHISKCPLRDGILLMSLGEKLILDSDNTDVTLYDAPFAYSRSTVVCCGSSQRCTTDL